MSERNPFPSSLTECHFKGSTPTRICAFRGSNVKPVVLPSGLTEIGKRAFAFCEALTSLHFPSSLTRISDGAFRGCTGLTSLVLPSGLTEIGKGAFSSCTGLINLHLPSTLVSIGENAFGNCDGLKEVRCHVEEPIAVDPSAFSNRHGEYIRLFVPQGSVERYRKAPVWKYFMVKPL